MKYNSRLIRVGFVRMAVILPMAMLIGIAGALLVFQSCRQKPKTNDLARFVSDKAQFVVDESFRPIFDEELYIFKALDDKVHPTILYKTENEAINLLLADSVRLLLISRNLNEQELKALGTRNLRPVVSRFAIDAIAIIVNQASNDTNITVSEIKKMLNGDTKTDKNIVFDDPNSGIVRYLKDFSGNKDFNQKNIFALKSNKEAINYVSAHPNAIGIVGFSWLNDPDKDYAAAVEKVKIVAVRDDISKNSSKQYFTPSQTTMALKQYPLTRNLYLVNCTGKTFGLGMEFAKFLQSDRGQRIILKSGLLPDVIPDREISIRTKF